MPSPQPPFEKLDIARLSDQFTAPTKVARRNLLVASSLAIGLSVEGLRFVNVLGVNLSDTTSAQLAIGAIGVIALYEFCSFIVYGVIDQRSWRLMADSIVHRFTADSLNEIGKATISVRSQLDYIRGKMTSDADSVVDAIKSQSGVIDRVVLKADEQVSSYVEQIAELGRRVAVLNRFQLGRIYLVDWGVPLLLGSLGVYRNLDSMRAFVVAVFS